MNKYAIIAQNAINSFDGGDIDSFLDKIAKENNLNRYEHQRLIEEYNIGKFLSKLQRREQHEEFQVANPVVIEEDVTRQDDGSNINKTASYTPYNITPDMFALDKDLEDKNIDLYKIATYQAEVDSYIYNIEDKWEKADNARQFLLHKEAIKREQVAEREEELEKIAILTKELAHDPGMVKTAVAFLAKHAKEDIAEDILIRSKFSSQEVKESMLEPITFKAQELLQDFIYG